jgi:hypothetical protein
VDVPDCLSRHLHNAIACTTTRRVAVDAHGVRLERQAVLSAGGSYLDVTPWLCTSSTCAALVGNLLAYRDDNHLTTNYTTWLSPLLGDQLDQIIRTSRPAPAANQETPEDTRARCLGMMRVDNVLQVKPR